MKRLIEDKTKIGPGYYEVHDNTTKKSPRAIASWGTSKTCRDEHFVKRTTLPTVGPGSYEMRNEADRKLNNSSFARGGQAKSLLIQHNY